MKPFNIIVVNEEKFEKWLKEQNIEFTKDSDYYKLSCKVKLKDAMKHGVTVMNTAKFPFNIENARINSMEKLDSNKIIDMKLKMRNFPEFIRMIKDIPAARLYPNIDQFALMIQERFAMGSLKYGGTWTYLDMVEEMRQEIYDIAAYAYLEWLKRKENKKLKHEDELMLTVFAACAFVLWNFLEGLKDDEI